MSTKKDMNAYAVRRLFSEAHDRTPFGVAARKKSQTVNELLFRGFV